MASDRQAYSHLTWRWAEAAGVPCDCAESDTQERSRDQVPQVSVARASGLRTCRACAMLDHASPELAKHFREIEP